MPLLEQVHGMNIYLMYSEDSEPKEQNITLNVNVKKGIFEVGKVDGGIFYFPSSDKII